VHPNKRNEMFAFANTVALPSLRGQMEDPARGGVFVSEPVSRILSWVTIYLAAEATDAMHLRPTWTYPDRVIGPAWPSTGRGLPGRRVTATPVRSYRTISPLPVLH
jgi:hypothetical protein